MRKTILLLVLCGLIFSTVASAATQSKPRMAVLRFEWSASASWWNVERFGDAAADMFTTELFGTGKFTVLERARLGDILKEHNLAASGAVTPQTAVELGKLLGVDYMVLGTITQFGKKDIGGRLRRFSAKYRNYNVEIDIRVVDVQTAELVYAKREGSSYREGGAAYKDLSLYQDTDYNRVAGKTMEGAVTKLVNDLGSKASSMTASASGGVGSVAMVDGADVYINRGSNAGIQAGDRFEVVRMGKKIVDPETGQTLGQKKETVGIIEVVSIEGASLSICKIVSGEAKKGDLIK